MLPAACAAIVAIGATSAANATVVFSENFDGEGTTTTLNFDDFDQFTVADGSVDLVTAGEFSSLGLDCVSGNCVDLDGSGGSPNAALLVSDTITFLAGESYTLSFDYAGGASFAAGNPAFGQTDSFIVSLGSLFSATIDTAVGDPFQTFSQTFTVPAGQTLSLAFTALDDPDFIGAAIDNILIVQNVTAAPLPAALPLMLSGFAGLIGLSRRKKKTA